MDPTLPTTLRREFRHRVEAAFQRRLAEQHRAEERKDRRERAQNDADDFVEMAAATLTESEVELFTAELDTYDEATVIALQENEKALEEVRERIDDLLARAHVLPDGRRVFKTEDGLQVFDESGVELDKSVIDPNEISDTRPTWEMYQPALEEEARLRDERISLLDYQTRLDEARERIDSGEMTRDEYDKLRTGLKDGMPEAVRSHLNEPDQAVESSAKLDPDLEITSDMLPTGMTPKIS